MKTLFFASILVLAGFFSVNAQDATTATKKQVWGMSVQKDASGNYSQVIAERKGRPEVKKETGSFLTLKNGEKLPVYESSKGKLFVERKSQKTGKVYRSYLEVADNSAK